jgi:NifU-like protein
MKDQQKIVSRLQNIKNAGLPERIDCLGKEVSFSCGTATQFALQIERDQKRIVQAKFKTNGCSFAVAAADVLADMITNKTLSELGGLNLEELKLFVETQLNKFPVEKQKCLDMVLLALKMAFADFRRKQVEEFVGEKALICTCFCVSEDTIERLISEGKVKTVEDVGRACRAGNGCGSCRILIQEMLDLS